MLRRRTLDGMRAKLRLIDAAVEYSGYNAQYLRRLMRKGAIDGVKVGQTVKLNGLAGVRLETITQSIEVRARTLWNIGTLSATVLAGGGSTSMNRCLYSSMVYLRICMAAPACKQRLVYLPVCSEAIGHFRVEP